MWNKPRLALSETSPDTGIRPVSAAVVSPVSCEVKVPDAWVKSVPGKVRSTRPVARPETGTAACANAVSGPAMSRALKSATIRELAPRPVAILAVPRSEEHTSELQSRLHLVCRHELEKKNFEAAASPSTPLDFAPEPSPVCTPILPDTSLTGFPPQMPEPKPAPPRSS